LITSFFTNYRYSNTKTLDASIFRKILLVLNESIDKFNLTGVNNNIYI